MHPQENEHDRPSGGADTHRGKPSEEAHTGDQVVLEEKPKTSDRKDKEDERLDEGVEESFPASDPVSVKITKI